jgi:alpha-N-arabinofuranosidase
MAGIKIHAAIDTEISCNHIHRTQRGIWLDWMAQGARVTRNLLHDNDGAQDLFFEVNHGPFLVDHNICLSRFPKHVGSHWQSPHSVLDVSQGGAYVHNLFLAGVLFHDELRRETPFMKPGSTAVAGLRNIPGGDDRFYNNVLVNSGLEGYGQAGMPSWMQGNVYLQGARPSPFDKSALQAEDFEPAIRLVEKSGAVYLEILLDKAWSDGVSRSIVTTQLLGKAKVPDLPFEQADGSPLRLDTDYLGQRRDPGNPFPGPFEVRETGKLVVKVWPSSS